MYTTGARLMHPVTELTDEELVRQFQNGSIDAFRLLVERYEEKVRSVILYTMNRDDVVDDIAQDVFVKVYLNLNKFRLDSKFYTWLYRIVVNQCRDEIRKNRWKRFIRMNKSSDEIVNKLDQLQTVQSYDGFGDIVREALQQLPRRQREIIVLKDIEDNTYEEIAEILQCEIGTVKSRLSRARSALRKILTPLLTE